MSDAPSVQLVLSYAAFEKNQNDKAAAFAVYKEGISLFSKAAKLREDAGVLAGSMGKIDEAARLLLSALQLCRSTEQAGEMGVLLALARKIRGVFRFRYRHKSPRVVQVQCQQPLAPPRRPLRDDRHCTTDCSVPGSV